MISTLNNIIQQPYMLLGTLFAIGCAVVLYLHIPKKQQFPSPAGWPLIGNLLQLDLFRYTRIFENWHKELGDTVEVNVLHLKYIDTVQPDIVKQIIHCNERDELYLHGLSDVFGKKSVILASGNRWKVQRKLLNPVFSPHALQVKMRENPEFLESAAAALVRRLGQVATNPNVPHLMDMELSRVSLAVIGSTLFGYDFGYSTSNAHDPDTPLLIELWNGLDEFNKRLTSPLRKYLNPPAMWRFYKTMRTVRQEVHKLIQERKAKGNVNAAGEKYNDPLSVLLDAEAAGEVEGVTFEYQDVLENAVTLVLAGHETTAHTLSFALYEIAQNPEIEQKLIAELDAFGNNRPIRYNDLNGGALPYVSQVVQETLRLHPVAPSIMRGWHKGQELGNTIAAENCTVGTTLTMLHFDERVWPSPHKFDPSRFDPTREEGHEVTSYLPFGGGQRTCIGKRLALLELKYLLATLYRNFTFKLVSGFQYDVKICVTMHETHGMPLLLVPRSLSA